MKINRQFPAKFATLCLFSFILMTGAATFSFADNAAPDDGVVPSSSSAMQDEDILDLLADINSPTTTPVIVTREKGGEPHARFGYERGLTPSDQQSSRHKIFQYTPDAPAQGTDAILSELSKEVAGKVYYELKEEGMKNLSAKVAVVAAVPLSDLKRETEFGRIIAEYHLTDLADRGIKVTELRMGSDINILPQTGEFILSRNIGELATNAPSLDYVVVSTFTNTRKTLILQGRLISLASGLIKTSWRYTLPLDKELLGLFYGADHQPFKIAVKGIGQ